MNWSAAFTLTGRAVGLAVIGGQALVTVMDTSSGLCSITALSADGLFTPLVAHLPYIPASTPFLGGHLYLLAKGLEALWMSGVGTFRTIKWDLFERTWANPYFPRFDPGGFFIAGGAVAAFGNTIYFATYASEVGKRFQDVGGDEVGSIIVSSTLTERGFESTILATPESVAALRNVYVGALAVDARFNTPPFPIDKLLDIIVGENVSAADTPDFKFFTLKLWSGAHRPSAFDPGGKWLRTSRLPGDHWHTKKYLRIRGMATSDDSDGLLTLRLYLDGATTAAQTFDFTADGTPQNFTIAAAHFGRDFALQWESRNDRAADKPFEILLPWEVAYFAVPEQQDMVRLRIRAGMPDVTRMGGLTMESRATVLANLQTIVKSQERWTIDWWDGTPQWTVIPLSYTSQPVEGQHDAGGGIDVAELILQRVA